MEEFGELRARVVGGTDGEGGGEGPVVVLLHGFGAPGDDLVGLWQVLNAPPEVRFVFPEAPISLGGMGGGMFMGDARAWWLIDVERMQRAIMEGRERDLTGTVPEGLAEARGKVVSMLDAVERSLGVTGEQVVLGGFSQGAMLALDTALQANRRVAGLVLMSGTLLAKDSWVPKMKSLAGIPVLQSHGEIDQLLPFGIAEQLHAHLTEAGADVTWIPFHGGHEIPPPVLAGVQELIAHHLLDGNVRA